MIKLCDYSSTNNSTSSTNDFVRAKKSKTASILESQLIPDMSEKERLKYLGYLGWYQSLRNEENWLKLRKSQDDFQTSMFINWINEKLEKTIYDSFRINNLYIDLHDGLRILYLLEILYNVILIKEKFRFKLHRIKNFQTCIDYMETERKVKCVGINSIDLADGNRKILLGLLFLIKHDYEYVYMRDKLEFIRNDINHLVESKQEVQEEKEEEISKSKLNSRRNSSSGSKSDFFTHENSFAYELAQNFLPKMTFKSSSSEEDLDTRSIQLRNVKKNSQEYEMINNLVQKNSKIDELYNSHVKSNKTLSIVQDIISKQSKEHVFEALSASLSSLSSSDSIKYQIDSEMTQSQSSNQDSESASFDEQTVQSKNKEIRNSCSNESHSDSIQDMFERIDESLNELNSQKENSNEFSSLDQNGQYFFSDQEMNEDLENGKNSNESIQTSESSAYVIEAENELLENEETQVKTQENQFENEQNIINIISTETINDNKEILKEKNELINEEIIELISSLIQKLDNNSNELIENPDEKDSGLENQCEIEISKQGEYDCFFEKTDELENLFDESKSITNNELVELSCQERSTEITLENESTQICSNQNEDCFFQMEDKLDSFFSPRCENDTKEEIEELTESTNLIIVSEPQVIPTVTFERTNLENNHEKTFLDSKNYEIEAVSSDELNDMQIQVENELIESNTYSLVEENIETISNTEEFSEKTTELNNLDFEVQKIEIKDEVNLYSYEFEPGQTSNILENQNILVQIKADESEKKEILENLYIKEEVQEVSFGLQDDIVKKRSYSDVVVTGNPLPNNFIKAERSASKPIVLPVLETPQASKAIKPKKPVTTNNFTIRPTIQKSQKVIPTTESNKNPLVVKQSSPGKTKTTFEKIKKNDDNDSKNLTNNSTGKKEKCRIITSSNTAAKSISDSGKKSVKKVSSKKEKKANHNTSLLLTNGKALENKISTSHHWAETTCLPSGTVFSKSKFIYSFLIFLFAIFIVILLRINENNFSLTDFLALINSRYSI